MRAGKTTIPLLMLCLCGTASAVSARPVTDSLQIAGLPADTLQLVLSADSLLHAPQNVEPADSRTDVTEVLALFDELLAETASQATPEIEEPVLTDAERRRQRGLTDVNTIFVPKGQWVFGGTASYSTHTNEGYHFLIIEGIGSQGYNFKISPMIGYALSNNMALGGRFIYSRTLLKINSADLEFGDEETGTEIRVRDFYALRSSYQIAAIWRQYIPLGQSKRFAFFNEMSLTGGGVEAKFAHDAPVKGTYERGYTLSFGLSPGIVAFATNNMAIEVNVGVMGITYDHTKQTHNQVTVGKREMSMMNFKVNIFSIGLGVAFYL